jgi:hypothetical protein
MVTAFRVLSQSRDHGRLGAPADTIAKSSAASIVRPA